VLPGERRRAPSLRAAAQAPPARRFGARRAVARRFGAALTVALLASAGSEGAAGAAGRTADSRSGGIGVAVGCSADGARCGLVVVLCSGDGHVTEVLGLTGAAPGAGPGGLVVRVGGPCAVGSSPPSPPPSAPPSTPPTPPGAPTTPPTAPPTTSSPPPGPAPSAGPAGAPTAAPPPSAQDRTPPVTRILVSASTRAHPRPRPAPAPAGGRPVGGGAPSGPAVVLPVAQQPPDHGPDGTWDRWWGLSLVAVLLPAALTAALPRGPGRRH
jgi:hypothetical protein